MQFQYKYSGNSSVASSTSQTSMSFAPDTLRSPTFFRGTLGKKLSFREAISALHAVVISDLRWRPKAREAYKAWAAEHEQEYLQNLLAENETVRAKSERIQAELRDINRQSHRVMGPFHKARQQYFSYIYKRDRDAWFVLDPVITVHPDEVFFECFSQDESSYGRLGCSYEVFDKIEEFSCGTTNVDYSDALYQEFQKIRNYKRTDLVVDPGGFAVETEREEAFKELKIDLPDSWVRGFLQVSSAMTLPSVELDLHPMDIYNLCFILRRKLEKTGPRSIRFQLRPGEPIQLVFEPWNTHLTCPRSIYHGPEATEIRIWGRRRLLILERLIPIAQRFKVRLLGTGLPSFFIADLGHLNFTLGLSGWTKNDWSRAGQFDLLAPRAQVDLYTKSQVFNALRETWSATADELAQKLQLDRAIVKGALSAYAQAGRVIYDLNKDVYRVRELSREPLPFENLRFANEREAQAQRLLQQNAVKVLAIPTETGMLLKGEVRDGNQTYYTELTIDRDQRLVAATCQCRFYVKNKLYQGPCEHILATRLRYAQGGA